MTLSVCEFILGFWVCLIQDCLVCVFVCDWSGVLPCWFSRIARRMPRAVWTHLCKYDRDRRRVETTFLHSSVSQPLELWCEASGSVPSPCGPLKIRTSWLSSAFSGISIHPVYPFNPTSVCSSHPSFLCPETYKLFTSHSLAYSNPVGPIYPPTYPTNSINLSILLYIRLSIHSLILSFIIYLSIFPLSIPICIYRCIHSPIYCPNLLFIHSLFYPLIHASVHTSTCSINLPTHLVTHPYISPSI